MTISNALANVAARAVASPPAVVDPPAPPPVVVTMHAIRMLEAADGSPNGHTVYRYQSGVIYTRTSEQPVSDALMAGFVASGRAVEVDAAGNTVGEPVDRQAYLAALKADVMARGGSAFGDIYVQPPDDEGYNSPYDQIHRRRR